MLVLNDRQVKELEQFIQELPVKFGVPLINLIRSFAEEMAKSNEQASAVNSESTPLKKVEQVIEAE